MRPWGRFGLIGVAYWAAHLLGFLFQSPVHGVCPVWPASGVGLAIVLLVRREAWLKTVLLLSGISLLSNLVMSGASPMSFGFTAANAVEFWGATWLMRVGRKDSASIHTVTGVMRFSLVATLWPLLPALIGAGTAHLGAAAPFGRTYLTWWIGDALGILLVTPLVLCWARPDPALRATSTGEALVLAAVWALATWFAFHHHGQSFIPLEPYMLLPLLAWTAIRLGGRGVTTALVALAVAALLSALSDRGVRGAELEAWLDRLFTVQVYVAVASVQSLLLAASTTTAKLMERTAREDEARVRRAEEEARSTAASLRFALDAAHMGTWEWDIHSGKVAWAGGVEAIFGLPRQGFTGTYDAYLDLVHPEDRDFVVSAIDGAVKGGGDYCIEHRVIWPDGTLHWLEGKGSVHRNAAGQALRMTGTVAEVTARKQAEADLSASEQRLRHFIRHTPAAIAMFDTEMRYLHVADRWLADYGLQGESILGRSHYEVFPDLPERWREVHRRVMAGAVERCEEDVFERADGTTEWLQWEMRPWYRARGEIGGCIMFAQLITERKHALEAEQRMNEALRQNQKLEALGTLAGGIAHDFNNILGGMLAFTELAALENQDRPELLAHLREVTLAGQRATGLVGQILSFSRQQRQERKPVSLGHVVEEALKLLRSTLPASIQIVVRLPGSLPDVLADGTQLHQVVMNLCTNAAHAVGGRGRLALSLDVGTSAELDVRPRGEPPAERYVRLTVEDDGHGMDAATVARIFEPFFTTKQPGDGTGLGLAVVHGIVNDHGGSITVTSQPGRGTTFTVALPVAEGRAALPQPRTGDVPVGRGERILLVDDERILCEVARRFLVRAGYQADTCLAAEDAWHRVESDPDAYSVVVSDLTMPGMSGLDLAARIHSVRPNLPVVLTSGHAPGLTTEMLSELGVCELLQKPVDHAGLTRAVARAVRRGASVARA
ncbi:MAG TPA: ATP-binding protein [Polyangiaceae bacterium]|nr:ATP-binding protein [Polyangiaceae bacterium]